MFKELIKLCFILISLGRHTFGSIWGNKLSKAKLTRIYRSLLPVEDFPAFNWKAYVHKDLKLNIPFVNYHDTTRDRNSLLNLDSQHFLALIAQVKNPQNILEIGFFMGSSMRLWLENSQAHITSVDIDFTRAPEFVETLKTTSRVTLIEKNSCLLTVEDFSHKFDLIFIDGAHDYQSIKSDTELALSILSTRGIIIWDDYKWDFPGVVKYLKELSKTHSLKHIPHTPLVILET